MAEMMIDEAKQLVRVTHHEDRLFTVDSFRRFHADMAKLAGEAAARFGRIRLLVDCRKLPIQPPDVAQHSEKPEQLLRAPEDRYALVLGSNLAKIQARRVLGNDERMRFFLSVEAAEAWLVGNEIGVDDAPLFPA